MRITRLRERMTAGLAVIALSMLAAPAKAACGAGTGTGGTFAPEHNTLSRNRDTVTKPSQTDGSAEALNGE